MRVEHGREHISISRLNAEEAELLQQEEGTPVFYESSIEFDKDMRFDGALQIGDFAHKVPLCR